MSGASYIVVVVRKCAARRVQRANPHSTRSESEGDMSEDFYKRLLTAIVTASAFALIAVNIAWFAGQLGGRGHAGMQYLLSSGIGALMNLSLSFQRFLATK